MPSKPVVISVKANVPDSLLLSVRLFSRARTSPPNLSVCFPRSEEHTSELQSPYDLVCRLLLEKKNNRYRRMLQFIHRLEHNFRDMRVQVDMCGHDSA